MARRSSRSVLSRSELCVDVVGMEVVELPASFCNVILETTDEPNTTEETDPPTTGEGTTTEEESTTEANEPGQ